MGPWNSVAPGEPTLVPMLQALLGRVGKSPSPHTQSWGLVPLSLTGEPAAAVWVCHQPWGLQDTKLRLSPCPTEPQPLPRTQGG